ncbi:MAG TPA: acyl-CoA dehydrogenase family protein [Ilumatobacteraceae bacterium]|nr:acyl-CoA dehydrogenase family protein [Ilumatobacteraceae bacterium]
MGPAPIVEAARDLAELIEAHADDGERVRRLPLPTVKALADAGLMRMCVPAEYGGPEIDPVTMVEAIAAVAHADGAAGWCTMIASTTSSMAAFLAPDAAREIYGDRSSITGGVFAPNGKGVATSRDGRDGFAVTGRWAWGSGTQHCRWVLGGTLCDDGTFRLCWFPQSEVTFHDTWYTTGMRGSGSLDYSVSEAFSPHERTMQPGVTRPQVTTPLAVFPNFTLLAAGVAAVGLGVARRAIDELVELAQGKKPQYSSRTLAQSGFTQVELARAEGELRAARAFLIDELGAAWDVAVAGGEVSLEARTGIRLAATHAASVAASVADVAFTLAGGTAVYDTSPLGRCLRDAHVVTQHIQTAPKLNETIGKLLLGVDVDTTMF